MSRPQHAPFGPLSLTEAIRAAVDNLAPEQRLRRRDVLKLDERHMVRRGTVPGTAASGEEPDELVFREGA